MHGIERMFDISYHRAALFTRCHRGPPRGALRAAAPPDLHRALVEMARREERSLNQQLIYLLRQTVRRDARRREREQTE